MSLMDWTGFSWNWTQFCPTGLTPFANDTNDLLPCFQEILLQLPVYTIFAAISAYNFGNQQQQVVRNGLQLRMLSIRTFLALVLALLPVAKVFVFNKEGVELHAVDVLVVSAECIMWVVHSGFLLTARQYGELSHRGSLLINVVWLTVVVLDGVWLRTSRHFDWWPWSLATLLCDLLFGFTLIPKGSAVYATANRGGSNREDEALLSPRYTYFHFDLNETHLGHAQDEANLASRFLFHWVHPLISKGVAGKLRKIEDLFDLPEALNITRLSERLHLALSQSQSLWRALHKCFGVEFYLIGILRLIADLSGFAGPLLLGGLLRQDHKDENQVYYYALGLFGSTLLSALCATHFDWRMAMVSMKMRVGVVNSIYRKALEARGLKDSKPDMLNLMSTDTDRIVNSCISFHFFWSIPFKLFTTLYLLYLQLGAAFLAGVAFAALLIPINRWLAKRIGIYSSGLMTAKDARLSATTETMQGAKQIKINAWEDIFISKIRGLRQEELRFLSKRKYLDAMCVYFWATTPVLMCLLTFGVSVLLGNPLIASTTYTSVALLYMLIGPLNAFPWVLNGLIEAWVSIKRVQQLMDVPNLDYSSYYNPIMRASAAGLGAGEEPPLESPKASVLQMKCASFSHDSEEDVPTSSFRLKDINVDIKAGQLICIEGPVGGGKSSFLSAIVANLQCTDGEVCVQELTTGFGYVPQSPWLQRGTIRDNIVWGAQFDEQWYKTVLHACALEEDLQILGGDLIGVGENGRTLSGGQRARVALARAVYQDKKVYLLDDVLSSLDAHVARHIIKHCILRLLKNKTRIVVTRSIQLFFHANQILQMRDGQLLPSEYMTQSIDLDDDLDEEVDDEREHRYRRSSVELSNQDDKKSVDSLLMEESREYGHLSGNVFTCYWKAVTTPLAITVLLSVLLMQLTRNLSDAWLAYWVTETTLDPHSNDTSLEHQLMRPEAVENGTDSGHTTGFYLSIFTAIAVSNSLVTLARAFLFAYAGIKAAIFMHEQLLKKVMFAKFNFFDITSVGRILNRFSSDTNTVDDSLPFILNILLAQLAGLIGALCVSLYAMPWLGLVVIPMVPIYLNLQKRYRHASRDIKRLSSNAMSPLYTHFTETLQGLTTIRSMRASPRFQRDFQVKLEESIKAQLTQSAAQQWLALRLQLLGTLLVGGAGLLAAITASHTTNPGLVGLCISYALSITGQLGDLLHAVAETEQELVAVERVDQYLQLEDEQNALGSADPPFGWPTQGVLKFQEVQLSYREHLAPALKGITFQTEAFERIGLVGRTGAGKTSVLSALLRVASLTQGEIQLDQVNLKTLALSVLRERIGVITQEPFLFEGTVRENLDPRHGFYDSEIWHAIKNSAAATRLVQQLGGLDGKVETCGNNLSAGQRQLLCLGRALLKNAKVVAIDEGTSNLDDESDLSIQQALRNAFKSCTLLFIAHRLRGLQAMDRIIVLEDGRVREMGKPQDLALNESTIFHGMLLAQDINPEEFARPN